MREFVTGLLYEQLTTAATVQFQNVGTGTLVIKRSVAQPEPEVPGWVYGPGLGERGAVADLYPSETGTLWARSDESTTVLVEEI
jgi:hypothetical protein